MTIIQKINTKHKITILDTTLREGEQSFRLCFSVSEKITFIKHLHNFGITFIEIGNPSISEAEKIACTTIVKEINEYNLQNSTLDYKYTNIELLVHARANMQDILNAKDTNATWIGIWISINDIALQSKFTNKNLDWIIKQAVESIILAKKLGFKVRFTIEDASRTNLEDIELLIKAIASIKNISNSTPDVLSVADTVGIWHPNICYEFIMNIKTYLLQYQLNETLIEVHLHNDLGLANSNLIAAINAGVSIIDASILGIGERAGICNTIELAYLLNRFYSFNLHNYYFNFRMSQLLADIVANIANFTIEPHRALLGSDVFTHSSKYHAKAIANNLAAYQAITPEDFNRQTTININKLVRIDINRINNACQTFELYKLKHIDDFKKDNLNLIITKPFIKGASELLHHRDGVGTRWVLMDDRVDVRSKFYIIKRIFNKDYKVSSYAHVDKHAHNCDSLFVFMGEAEDATGLTVAVTFYSEDMTIINKKIVTSPASVYIPATVYHSYEYISGIGTFLNIVLSANYNSSIL